MKVIAGTVVAGKVEVPKDALADGDRVAIVAADPTESIHLTPEQEAELVAAVEDIQRGKYVDGHELLAELRKRASRRDPDSESCGMVAWAPRPPTTTSGASSISPLLPIRD